MAPQPPHLVDKPVRSCIQPRHASLNSAGTRSKWQLVSVKEVTLGRKEMLLNNLVHLVVPKHLCRNSHSHCKDLVRDANAN